MAKPASLAFEPRPLLLAAGAAAAGALATRGLGAVAPILIALLLLAAMRCGDSSSRWRSRIVWCALPAAIGAIEVAPPALEWTRAGPVTIDATVTEVIARESERRGKGSSVVRLSISGHAITCVVHGSEAILPGDHLRGLARMGEQATRRIEGLQPWLETHADALEITPGSFAPQRVLAILRDELAERLAAVTRGEAGVLLTHLVLGRGPRLSPDVVDAHRDTGLAHLLAVSGAHASMLAWMLATLHRWLTGVDSWSSRVYRWFCGVFLCIYAAVTGLEPPMFRALVAFLLLIAANADGRSTSLCGVLALPALMTAWLQPADFGSVSFCLSYAAVLGLGLSGAFDPARSTLDLWRAPLRASLWAALLTTPFTLAYFGQFAPWTVLATPLLSPLVALMLALGVCVCVLGESFGFVTMAAGSIAMAATELYLAVIAWFGELPGAPIHAFTVPTNWTWGGAIAIVGGLLVWRRGRRSIAAACVVLSLPHFVTLPAVFAVDSDQNPGLTLCAIGHGQAALLRAVDGTPIVVDCGTLGDPARAGRALAEELGAVRRIEVLVVSHDDIDHWGGIRELTRRVRIVRAVLPEHMRGHSIVSTLSRQGATLTWLAPGDTQTIAAGVEVVAPRLANPRARDDDNELSLWVHADLGALRCLLPGDAATAAIDAWCGSIAWPADVLVLPHHGRGAVSDLHRLLETSAVTLALVSNRDGEEASPLGAAASAAGIPTLHTGARGTLRIRVTADQRAYLEASRPERLR